VPNSIHVRRLPRRPTKRSIKLGQLQTSATLEDAFWDGLREIAIEHGISVPNLVASIKAGRQHANLSSAIRVFVLRHYINQCKRAP
jgi:predicted DNA-binding ribbon-helix-helix protein